MKKLKLLVTKDCSKGCKRCCNKDWNLDSLPVVEHFDNTIKTKTAEELFVEYEQAFNRPDVRIEPLEDGWERLSFCEDGYTHSVCRKIGVGYMGRQTELNTPPCSIYGL